MSVVTVFSSTSVGVSFGVGASSAGLNLDIAVSRGKGQGNSDSITYNNSLIWHSPKSLDSFNAAVGH
jgi:hypothetical protein